MVPHISFCGVSILMPAPSLLSWKDQVPELSGVPLLSHRRKEFSKRSGNPVPG